MKCFIIIRDRLTWAKLLIDQCNAHGFEIILIDNGSTYPPLLEWYTQYEGEIIKTQNRTSWEEWYKWLLKTFNDRYFIITDPDIDISGLPDDFVNVMLRGLMMHDVLKCGLSLKIDDLPDNTYGRNVAEYEKRFWEEKSRGFYKADVSTTFALYDRERSRDEFLSAVRTPQPYTAKHRSWYLTEMNEEEQYYQNHSAHIGWKPDISK